MSPYVMLDMLKVDLGITTKAYDDRLLQVIQYAMKAIQREGATLDTCGSIEDANLVIMYAAWTWRQRDTMEGMPRMLRWALNNRIFSEKMGAAT